MFGALKQAGKEGLIYGIGQGLQGALAFLLVPIYTRALSQSDFGKLGLLLPIGVVAGTVVSMGLTSALFRSYFDYDDVQNRRLVINTTLLLLVLTSLVTLFVSVPVIPILSQGLFGDAGSSTLIWLVVVKGIMTSLGGVPLATYRAHGQAVKYAGITLTTSLLKVVVIIYFVVVERWGLIGVIGGDAITSVIATTIMLWTIRKDIAFLFSKDEARKLLGFGLPLVPADLASMVFARVDLFFLNQYTDLRTVGQYNAAALIIQAMQMLVKTPLTLSWTPLILSVHKKEYAQAFYARVTVYVLLITGAFALFISVFSVEIIRIVAGSGYEQAAKVLPLLCLAQVIYMVQICFGVGITLKRKTQFIPLILLAVALTALAAYGVFVPMWGMMGAAAAGLVSATVFALMTYSVSSRIYYVPQNWYRIIKVSLYFSLSYLFVRALETTMSLFVPESILLIITGLMTLILFLLSTWYTLEEPERNFAKRKLAIVVGIHRQGNAERVEPKL